MIPSIEHIIKKRHHNRRRLRFMALLLVVIGTVSVGWAVLVSPLVDHEWSPSMSLIAFASGIILPALPLWFFDERIGRALVPLPKLKCPACNYDLTLLKRPICPECGLRLPAIYVGQVAVENGNGTVRHA